MKDIRAAPGGFLKAAQSLAMVTDLDAPLTRLAREPIQESAASARVGAAVYALGCALVGAGPRTACTARASWRLVKGATASTGVRGTQAAGDASVLLAGPDATRGAVVSRRGFQRFAPSTGVRSRAVAAKSAFSCTGPHAAFVTDVAGFMRQVVGSSARVAAFDTSSVFRAAASDASFGDPLSRGAARGSGLVVDARALAGCTTHRVDATETFTGLPLTALGVLEASRYLALPEVEIAELRTRAVVVVQTPRALTAFLKRMAEERLRARWVQGITRG